MAATISARSFLPAKSSSFPQKSSKSSFSGNLNFKISSQKTMQINSSLVKTREGEMSSPSSSSTISFLNQSSDWNTLLNPMPIFEETNPTEVENENYTLIDEFSTNSGRLIENNLIFRQNVSIRSYEIGADGRISLEALMNHLQEAGLNHMKLTGLLGDGLGSTPEMTERNLFWVATKVQLVIDHYPTWGDDVVIDNWIVASGKNCMRRDSVIRDSRTGQTLIKASSNWVMMNKETRRLSRIPDEVRQEMMPYLMDASPILEDDPSKLPKLDEDTSDSTVAGIKPRWSDLDINQHVNNAKYIGWVLESAPSALFEDHEISRVTMEYRRECHRDDVLQSLTAVTDGVECHHLLRLEGGAEVMKARTEWRPRNVC